MFCRLWVCLLLLGPGVSMAEDPAAGLRERDGTAADWPQYLNSGNWLLVEVWDPDCPICNASVAEVIELDRQGQLLGLRVLGIALHEAGNTDAIDRYIEQHGIGFRNLLDSGANFAHIYQQLTGTSWGGWTPTFLLFDRDGKLVAKNLGPIRARDVVDIVQRSEPARS